RFPVSCVCHCNDCRTATGALLNFCLLSVLDWVSISLQPREPQQISAIVPEYIPAKEVFTSTFQPPPNSFLSVFESNKERLRAFCGRCGTSLFYFAHPMPEGWEPMLDIWTGTIDRADLEEGWMKVERHVWVEKGVDWVNNIACEGSGGVPKHPIYKVDGVM
ncbi:hypothetical protein LSUE1_G010391, partial [Lachnellula suecica]